jgi:hypothetical protein
MQATPLVGTIFAALGLLWSSVAIGHALLHKRRPQSAFGWIAVCFTLPFAGPLLYYLFGINRVRSRARRLLTGMEHPVCEAEFAAVAPPGREPLERLGFAVSGLPLAGALAQRLNVGQKSLVCHVQLLLVSALRSPRCPDEAADNSPIDAMLHNSKCKRPR